MTGCVLPQIRELWRMPGQALDIGGVESFSQLPAKGHELCGDEGLPAEEQQSSLWKDSFADPTQWWDNRGSKATPRHPDFGHNKSKFARVDSQLATWDARMKRPTESVSASFEAFGRLAAHVDHLEAMCMKLCEDGRITDAVDALNLLVQRGYHVSTNLYYGILKTCIAHKNLVVGRRIHALTIKSGYGGDAFLATHLIGLYGSCGMPEDAMRVFTSVCTPSCYNWAAIIFAYARHGEASKAILLYRQMRESATIKADNRIYVAILKACATAGDLVMGKEVHAHILEGPGKPDVFVQAGMVDMYAKCGSLEDACRVFDQAADRNVVTWNAMLAGYANVGMGKEALHLYRAMQHEGIITPNSVTFVCLLQACASVGALHEGKQLHKQILEQGLQDDVVVGGSLVSMYAKCGSLEDACSVFQRLSGQRNVVTWNSMIAGYAQQGMCQEALNLYSAMQDEGITHPDAVTFVCLLQACASVGVGALHQGRQLHAEIEERRLQHHVVIGGSLVNMYAKCGSLEHARSVFDKLPGRRNVVTWNAMIAGYVQQGMGQEALSVYSSMQLEGITPPDSFIFVLLLQACTSVGVGALLDGKRLHAQIEDRGLQNDVVVGVSLVDMYAKCGSLEDARGLFDGLRDKNVVTWTAMISGYVRQGMSQEALNLYCSMEQEGLYPPNSVTFACLLHACSSVGVGALHQGKQLHAEIEERGLQDDVFLGGSLVKMYAMCGSLKDAHCVFDQLSDRNVVTWNTMLTGYVHQGMHEEAFSLYNAMLGEGQISPDSVTFVCLLQACANGGLGSLRQGMQIHAHAEERGLQEDVIVGSSLVNMYAKCGSLGEACKMFERLPERNIITWNVMLGGYVQQGMGQEALALYHAMQQEGITPADSVTFVCLLQACASEGVGALYEGKQLHEQIEERKLQDDVIVGISLLNMYAKCGSLQDARNVFDRLPVKNVVAWTAMIAGYAHHGMGQEALSLYGSMQQEGIKSPDSVALVCLLQACASVGAAALPQGKQLDAQIEERGLYNDVVVGASLINMYAKCGSLDDACTVFDKLPVRNVVAWNAILGGYTQQGMGQEALTLYNNMQQEGITPPDSVTFVCLLQACAIVAALHLGRLLHTQIEEQGMQSDLAVGGALINMYAKCGSISDSHRVFDSLPQRTVEVWNALLGGYTRKGDSEVVFDLLDRMCLEGIQPDGITFLNVLTVCSHVGLVDKGRKYFEGMKTEYGISPTVEHCTCMMDLFGRAGRLDEALQMAKSMPFSPDGPVWRTLLSACRKWSNIEVGEHVLFEGVGKGS